MANGRTIRIASVGISKSGEAFANTSSLYLTWELSSCNGLAYWDDEDNSERSKYNWVRFLGLRNESGQVLQEFRYLLSLNYFLIKSPISFYPCFIMKYDITFLIIMDFLVTRM